MSPGELFLGAPPDKLTLEEARAYCRERGAEIATTGQLYAAWDGGLDRCSPGWLADGSVRYPIVTPSQRCGGGLPGVKTLFLFPNQTGFPNQHSRFNVYCFRGEPLPTEWGALRDQGEPGSPAPASAKALLLGLWPGPQLLSQDSWAPLVWSPSTTWPQGVATLSRCLPNTSPRLSPPVSHWPLRVRLRHTFSFPVCLLAEQR